MNILTKIFVVLVSLLTPIFVTLVVVYTTNVNTLNQEVNDLENQLELTEARARTAATARETAINQHARTVSRLNADIGERNEQIERLRAENERLRNTVTADLEAEITRLQTSNEQMAAAMEQQSEIIEALNTELSSRRTEMLDLQRSNFDLQGRLAETLTRVDVLERTLRFMKEEVASRDARIDELQIALQEAGAGRGATAARDGQPLAMAPTIRGMVTNVRQANDATFVALNVGQADQVREGMDFMLHRGNQFIATAEVIKVDANSALARVTLLGENIQPSELSANIPVVSSQ